MLLMRTTVMARPRTPSSAGTRGSLDDPATPRASRVSRACAVTVAWTPASRRSAAGERGGDAFSRLPVPAFRPAGRPGAPNGAHSGGERGRVRHQPVGPLGDRDGPLGVLAHR